LESCLLKKETEMTRQPENLTSQCIVETPEESEATTRTGDGLEKRDYSSPLAAALAYADAGFASLPLKVASKAPAINGGKNAATTDHAILTSYFAASAGLNIGVRTGPTTGICVLDIDPRNGGDKSLERLINERGPLPKTVTAITGGGGSHLLFYLPAGDHNWSADRPDVGGYRGVDLKNDGYIVAPPSLHPSGARYAWAHGLALGEVAIAELPSALLDLVTKPKRPAPQPNAFAGADEDQRAGQKADWSSIIAGCAFARACVEQARTLPEPWWHVAAGILAVCKDGRQIFHEISKPYADYDAGEANQKFDRAVEGGPPRTCRSIEEDLGFPGCRRCPFWRTA
jgi:hypothetical protein